MRCVHRSLESANLAFRCFDFGSVFVFVRFLFSGIQPFKVLEVCSIGCFPLFQLVLLVYGIACILFEELLLVCPGLFCQLVFVRCARIFIFPCFRC